MAKVLLLHTGGTLGMRGEPLEPSDYVEELLELVPELEHLADVDSALIDNVDSSDIDPGVWTALCAKIASERERYDGFVIVHGTDTMAFTASALSFSLRGLDRPVVLTGAQRPITALRTDARRNLADAVELATLSIPEVGVCFDGLLLRGCRASKSNSHDYRAFTSPGCAPLARLGVDVAMGDHIRRPTGPFEPQPRFDQEVLVVHVTPGMSPEALRGLCGSGVRGLVLVAFGLGTVPVRSRPVAPVVREIVDAGVEVLVLTSSFGRVNLEKYKNSLGLRDAGAISGGCMSVEAATTKLMHALAMYSDRSARRRYLEWDVAGELA